MVKLALTTDIYTKFSLLYEKVMLHASVLGTLSGILMLDPGPQVSPDRTTGCP
jgi:hypothetical protein